MKDPTPFELNISVLQFFALDVRDQLKYGENFIDGFHPCGGTRSPLEDLATSTYNIARWFDRDAFGDRYDPQPLQDFEIVVNLMLLTNDASFWRAESLRDSREWRLLRRLARASMQRLGYPLVPPCVEYRVLMPQMID